MIIRRINLGRELLKLSRITTKIRWLLIGIAICIAFEVSERSVDLVFGDGDGKLLTCDAGYFVTVVQLLIMVIACALFANQFKNRLAASLVGVSMTVATIVVVEAVSHAWRVYTDWKTPPPRTFRFGYVVPDSNLGYRLRADTSGYITLVKGRDTIFSNKLTIDQWGRRVTWTDPTSTGRKYALFLGCSYTFGHSVDDTNTLPSLFSRFCPDYRSYNYGVQGYGTQQIPLIIESIARSAEVPESTGLAVYTFVDQHVNRVICDKLTTSWAHSFPYFRFENGELKRVGNFDHDRWYTTTLYSLLNKSDFLSLFNFNIPRMPSNEDYRLTAALIRNAKIAYEAKFRNSNFFVLIYPGESNRIIEYLQGTGVQILDLSSMFPADSLKVDGHPTATSYVLVAKRLAQIICAKPIQ